MDDVLTRIWEDLAGRISGLMSFRVLMQPAIASLLAIRAGVQDGTEKFGLGPSVVALSQPGQWTLGFLFKSDSPRF